MALYPIITLCGSTKFKDKFIEVQRELTLKGNVVISVGLFGHADHPEVFSTPGVKDMLDAIHKQKIDMSDAIYVINVGGYIGASTRDEIAYAKAHGKKVYYLEGSNENE